MSRGLSDYEQETIITFNKEEAIARIFTFEKTWQQHLEKRLGLKSTMNNGFGGKEYEISKKRIKPPRAPIKLSAEARAKIGKRLGKFRKKTRQDYTTTLRSDAEKKKMGNILPNRKNSAPEDSKL